MHRDDRKKDKTGTLALSQSKARALATGVGQSQKAAMITGSMRAQRVADCIPPSQEAAVKGAHTGYPAKDSMMLYGEPASEHAATTRPLRGRVA